MAGTIYTPTKLFRSGNASNPRLANVRPNKDVTLQGDIVIATGKGISTFDAITNMAQKNIWMLIRTHRHLNTSSVRVI